MMSVRIRRREWACGGVKPADWRRLTKRRVSKWWSLLVGDEVEMEEESEAVVVLLAGVDWAGWGRKRVTEEMRGCGRCCVRREAGAGRIAREWIFPLRVLLTATGARN